MAKAETPEELDGQVAERRALEEIGGVANRLVETLPPGAVRDQVSRVASLSGPRETLRLSPNHADLAARLLAYKIQDTGEGMANRSGHFEDEVFQVSNGADVVVEVGTAIQELRGRRESIAVDLVAEVVEEEQKSNAKFLGFAFIDVLRSQREDAAYKPTDGYTSWTTVKGSHERDLNNLTDRAMMLRDILDVIGDLRQSGGES